MKPPTAASDPVYANADADRVLPVDVLRDLEKEGVIGSLHQFYYATVGNGTAVASAKAFAAEIAQSCCLPRWTQSFLTQHLRNQVTRCGATMAKETERAGLPVVHICNDYALISKTVGATIATFRQ